MKLYYGTGACSLAPHIVLREAGIKADLVQVDLRTKQVNGRDFKEINHKGYVPALELDNGEMLTEASIIVQYLADQKSDANLIPKMGTMERYRCQEWLNFVSAEIHKGIGPFWNPATPAEYKTIALTNLGKRFDFLTETLSKSDYLMGRQFTVADAYLFTVVNWTKILNIDISKWPSLMAYMERVGARPGVQAALREEGLLK